MVSKELSEAAVELNAILENTSPEIVDKIPRKFIDFMKEIASPTYKFEYNQTKELEEQVLKPKTKGLIALIYKDFLCNSQEKEEYMQHITNVLEDIEKEKREKYNPDNIFKNNNVPIEEKDKFPEVVKKKTFFMKLIIFLKNIFHCK